MSLTCLLVDDEPNLLLTLTHILRSAGYHVIAAQNPLAGLAALQEQSVDVMVVDLKMPQVDGISLIKQVRATHANLPIIIMTAYASLETAIEAVRQGARDYLLKPVDPAHLLERIRTILSEEMPASKRRALLGKMQSLMQELQTVDDPLAGQPHTMPLLERANVEHIRSRGGLMMNLRDHQVVWNGNILHLSPTNFDYLLALLNACPNPVPLEKLVQLAQGYQVTRHEAQEIVRWRMRELRGLLEPDPANPRHILTVRSVGYRLHVDH
jgi:DNA-binding response OmpR family regulator